MVTIASLYWSVWHIPLTKYRHDTMYLKKLLTSLLRDENFILRPKLTLSRSFLLKTQYKDDRLLQYTNVMV